DRKRQATLLVCACHRQEFLLRPIAQLTLPEARCPFRKYRGMAGCIGVMFHNFGGGSASGDPVIELRRRFGHPARLVVAQFNPTDRRVEPEEAIASTGEQKGNRHLSIPLDQVDGAALLVESSVLVLP